MCGVLWSILWFLVVKETPAEDPHISKEERDYIEQNLAQDTSKKVSRFLSYVSEGLVHRMVNDNIVLVLLWYHLRLDYENTLCESILASL